MSYRKLTTIVAGVVLLSACTDGTGPPPEVPAPMMNLSTGEPLRPLRHSVSLETHQTSVWAVRGQTSIAEIHYREMPMLRAGGEVQHGVFLRFVVPPYALYAHADGSRIGTGDSVLITITVDRQYMIADFQPSGLTFLSAEPAQLEIWYGGAEQDLDGDGDVDADDEALALTMLSLWHQQSGRAWLRHPSLHSRPDRYLVGEVTHFSGYAVSW